MTTISAVQHEMSARMSRQLTEQLGLEAGLMNDLRTAWIYPQPVTPKKKVAVYELTVPTRTSMASPLWKCFGEETQFSVIEKAVCFFSFSLVHCTCYNNHGLSVAVRLHKVHKTNRCAKRVARPASHEQFVRNGMELDKSHHQEGKHTK